MTQPAGSVQTARGPVEPSDLGVTLAHEHLRTRHESVAAQWPHLFDEDAEVRAIARVLESAHERGVRTLCDATVMGLGRDMQLVARVAEATSVNVVVATGIYTFADLPPYFAGRSVDVMADAFVHDITVGIQRTPIRAGFLKCATEHAQLSEPTEKVLRATARAQRRTGVPIMTHSAPRTRNGALQLDVLEDEGVDPAAVALGHSGDTDDVDHLEELARRGAYLSLDRYGMDERLDRATRNRVVAELVARGWADQLLLSQDHSIVRDIRYPDDVWRQRSSWGTTLVVDTVVEELDALGVPPATVAAMLTTNAARWLTPREISA